MNIELQWEIPIPEDLESLGEMLDRVAESCLRTEGIEGAGFAVRIVNDEAIRALNREMRQIDQATDVLSFPTVQFPMGKTARDCPKRLKREYDPYCGYINLGD